MLIRCGYVLSDEELDFSNAIGGQKFGAFYTAAALPAGTGGVQTGSEME